MEISLLELLNSDFFRESKVLAGEKGLANKVTSVNVLDAPDGDKYMKEGALVVTTAYSLLNKPEDQQAVVERLSQRKVAALGIKLRFFNYQLPEIMKKTADEHGLPIISLSNEYAYADILEFLMSNIFSRQTKTFLRKEKVYDQFVKSAENYGLKGVAELLSNLTGLPVALFFEEDVFEYPYNFLPEDFRSYSSKWQKVLLNEIHSDLNECVYRYSWQKDAGCLEWIGVEFKYRNNLKGFLLIFQGERTFDKNDYLFLDFAAMAGKVEIQKVISIEQERQKYKSQYLEQLFEGQIETKEEAFVRAKALDWVLPAEAQVFYIKIANRIDCFDLEIVRAANKFFTEKLNKQIIVAAYGCGVVILFPTNLTRDKHLPEELSFALRKKFSSLDFYIGVGRPATFKEFKKSLDEATHAVEIGLRIGSNQRVFRFEHLGVYRLLFITKSPEEIRKFYEDYLKPVISFDQENKTELASTLKLFLANGCNYSITAKQLFLHPNSVRYRLHTIERICKVNLKSEEDRLSISLAFKLAPLVSEDCKKLLES